MNRSNTGANTNTLQILMDILVMAIAYALDVFVFGRELLQNQHIFFFVLFSVFTLIYVLANKEAYLYNVTLFYYLDRVHRKLTKSFLTAMIATSALLYFMTSVEKTKKFYIVFLLIAYVLVCVKMFINKKLMRYLQRKTIPRTAFVGKVGEFNKFRYFLDKTSIHIEPVGYIAMKREDMELSADDTYLGCLEDLENLIRTYNLDQLYIIQKDGAELPFTQQYVDLCISMGVTVRLVVDLYKRRRASSYVSTVGTYPIITYHTISLNTYEQMAKRLMDIVGGLVGIILSSPIMLITAIAIKLDSKGPVIFKQTRVGQNGRHFKIYKFRSMYIDAEERKKELMAKNEIEGGVMFKMKDDPRITRVGKVIRKLSIDELPQFFNIFLGSMSLVGTRPPTLDEVEKYKRDQWRRISIKPGLTGMWQVNGRSNIQNFDEIVELDVEYIDNWSLFLDIKILLKTVWVILARKGAC
ncbi:MAG: sugar transferase [Lachnospiraceae bacterium]|nr:sugar transferase [Lachnospiraceae bacterium]